MYILAVNPGTVTTKYAVFQDRQCLFEEKFEHTLDVLKRFGRIYDQYQYRMDLILEDLKAKEFDIRSLSAVVGRGGLLKPLPGGTYAIDEQMLEDLRSAKRGEHASNLGAALAHGIAAKVGVPSFIVDPVAVDELDEVARITGIPEIQRVSLLHTLNHKAVARKVAEEMGRRYEEVNFVIAHLGTGFSVAAHRRGRAVDMCDARGEGPFSCERCGAVNSYLILQLYWSGKYTREELTKIMYSQSGLYGHLGTKDAREAERMVKDGDPKATLVVNAMLYQIAKEIGAQAAALSGEVDRIILTGGIAYSEFLMEKLTKMVEFIAPVVLVPGEEELQSLALGALRVLRGEEQAKTYA